MKREVVVSAVMVEKEDGTYRAWCPELGVEAEGVKAEEALSSLKEAVRRHIESVGPEKIQLYDVKCMKFKIEL